MVIKADSRSEQYLSDLYTLTAYQCEMNLYGDSIQVLTFECDKETLISMGFSYSRKNDFYWKKY